MTTSTTGAKIELSYCINGHSFGEEFVTDNIPLTIEYSVKGTDLLLSVELVSNNGTVFCEQPKSAKYLKGIWKLPAPMSHAFYYLRVTQVDFNMAWSSPIWIDFHRVC